MDRRLLSGDKTMWIELFGIPLGLLVILGDNVAGPTFGGAPVGLCAAVLLSAMIVGRAFGISGAAAAT